MLYKPFVLEKVMLGIKEKNTIHGVGNGFNIYTEQKKIGGFPGQSLVIEWTLKILMISGKDSYINLSFGQLKHETNEIKLYLVYY